MFPQLKNMNLILKYTTMRTTPKLITVKFHSMRDQQKMSRALKDQEAKIHQTLQGGEGGADRLSPWSMRFLILRLLV